MILRDISYAFRMMAKDPGFTAVVALSIALGIAANTTVFSLANATLFSSLPVPDPGGLYAIGGVHATTSYPDYRDFRDRCRDVFAGLSAHFPLAPANMSGARTPERVWGQLVSGNYFSLVGPPLLMGRGIAPREDAAVGSEPVVVLSHGLWRRRFGGDPNILGKSLVLSGRPYTIIGVTASGFRGTDGGVIAEFFAPLSMRNDFMPELTKDAERRDKFWLVMTGRLKPGVSRKQAVAAINLVSKQLDEVHRKGRRSEPVPLVAAGGIPGASGFINGFMALLMATVVLVLLVACANAANLLLARAVERQHEMGVRMAIGAGRARLIRQLLAESVALSMVGAVGGFALAFLATRALSGLELPVPLPVAFDFTPDLRVLGLTAALAVATGILFGLAPAFSATRKDLVSSLRLGKSRSGTSRRMGLGKLLVGVQVTLSVVLLTGAGLFLRSLQSAASLDLGIRPDNVLMLSVDPKTNNYSPERTRDFLRQLDRRVTALPGVQSLTAVNLVPLSFASNHNQYVDASAPAGKRTDADVFHVTSAYFDTMGIPLVRGRDFSPERDLQTSTALVSLTMARRLFGSEDPIGRRVSGGGKTYEIVGLVGDSKTVTLGEEVKACIYAYLPRDPSEIISLLGMTVFVKTTGAPGRMIGPVRAQVEALDPNLAVFNAGTLSDHVTKAFFLPRVCAWLFGAFGAVGLTLATVGLFGLLSYSVRSRTREIGIRMALGAAPAAILILVLRQALILVVISLIVGIGVSIALSRVTASLLYGVSATDPITFTVVPLVLLGAALAAVVVPARRAMGVEPLDALRSE